MLTIISSERFGDHRPPEGHPERPARAEVMHAVAEAWRNRGPVLRPPRAATGAELSRVHDEAYVDAIAKTDGRTVSLDPDTYTSPESYAVATLAAGGAAMAVDLVCAEPSPTGAVVLGRPPGHHAERARAMGFCLFNNVAVAAAHARTLGVERVAIVDFDVHHGNGTQWMFYDDATVLYVSTHQYPFYPGTGAAGDTGRGDGIGYTVNVPLAAGATDADMAAVMEAVVLPVLDQFEPSLLILSAGYDAHERDPLGGLRLTTAAFDRIVRGLIEACGRSCPGRLVVVTEGGYDTQALSECLDVTIGLAAGRGAEPSPPAEGDDRRARAAIADVRKAQAAHWRL